MAASPYDSTPNVAPTTGAPNDTMSVRASGQNSGVQVDQALEGLGSEIQKAGNQYAGVVIQHQGILNEMAATNGEAILAEKQGNIQSAYKSLEGLEAVGAHDHYVEQMKQAQAEVQATMPNLAAQRSFAMLTARSTAYGIRDMGGYQAEQFKRANKESTASGLKLALDQSGSPAVANDPARFEDSLGSIKFFTMKGIQDDGMVPEGTTTDKDGNPVFPDTPAGKTAESIYQSRLQTNTDAAQLNRIQTQLNDPRIGADVAWNTFQKNQDQMGPMAQARALSILRPRVLDAQTRDISEQVIDQAKQGYFSSFSGTGKYTEESASALVTGLMPGSQITSTKRTEEDNKRVGGVTNSDHLYGRALDFVPPHGMSMEDAAATMRKNNPDMKVIIGGPTAANPKEKPHIHIQWEGGTSDKVPTNDNGGHLSEADYYSKHYTEIIDNAGREAEARNLEPAAVEMIKAKTETALRRTIGAQEMQDRADSHLVQRAVFGEFNGGQKLTTTEQLENGPPEVRDAWHNVQTRDTNTLNNIVNHVLPMNASQSQKTYGGEFYDYYNKIESGAIHDPKQLLASAGRGLSAEGIQLLTQKMAERNTPEGLAFATQESKFLQKLHNDATGILAGKPSAVLEHNFVKQLPLIFNAITFAKNNHVPVAKMFDPSSTDYVGNKFDMPDPAVVKRENTKALLSGLNSASHTATPEKPSVDTAKKLWAAGKFKSKEELKKYLIDNKLAVDAPPVPGAHD